MYAGPRGLPAGGSPKLHRAPLLSHHPAKRRNRLLLIGLALLALSLWYWRAGHSRRGAVDVDIQTDDPESQVDAPGEIRAGPRDGDDDGASPDDGDDVTGGDAEPDSEPQANEKYGPGWLPRGDVSKLPDPLAGFSSSYPAFLNQLLLHRTSHAYPRFVAIVYVDDGDRDVLLNWLCHVRLTGFRNYVIVTRDEKLFWWLRYRAGESSVYLELPEGEEQSTEQRLPLPSGQRAAYNSPSFKSHMLYRTQFVLTLLEHGWNVLIADADAVWFEDPRPYLWRGVRQGAGIIAQDDVTMLCGGFMLLLSNEKVVALWREVTRLFNLDHKRTNEQLILKRLLESGSYDVKVHKLPQHLFPSGKHWFDRGGWKQVREQGWPVVVHNNFVRTKSDKLGRFNALHMWRVVSIDEGQCLDVPVPEYGSVIAPNSGKWQIEVRVLAANVDEAQRLLRELQVADYGDAKVDITVHLPDEHGPDVSAVTSKAYSHGALRVVVGKMEKPADIWVPGSETGPRLVAIATGKAQIAPSWHRTLLQLLARYAGDSYRDFDPRVFGFGLGTHDGYTAPANKGVYRYQRFAPLSVVFPWHWTRFVRAGPIFDPDLEETVARWIAVNGYYAIHAPGEDQGPSIAKLPSFDAFGRETKNPDALVSRSWWFETDAKEADDVIQRTAAPPSGSKRGKEPKPPKPPRGRKGKGGKGKGKGKKRE